VAVDGRTPVAVATVEATIVAAVATTAADSISAWAALMLTDPPMDMDTLRPPHPAAFTTRQATGMQAPATVVRPDTDEDRGRQQAIM